MAIKQPLSVAAILVGRGRSPVDEGHVAALAESMAKVGLLNPITVWHPTFGSNASLVAGAHRLAAAKLLGWEEIDCILLAGSSDDARSATTAAIAEIDENLIRRDLSPAERADLTARRKELYEAEFPETKVGASPGAGRGKGSRKMEDRQVGDDPSDRFTADVSRKTGRPERSIQRDATRGKVLGSATLSRIKGTSLDRGAALDALAKLPERDREDVVSRAERGEPVSLPRPPVERKPDPVDIARRALFRIETEATSLEEAVAIAHETLEQIGS